MRNPFFIFDMANNHNGDMDQAREIIDSVAKIAKDNSVNCAIKFQFRDLDTFIHPGYKDREDIKHIKRFFSTRLEDDQFIELVQYAQEVGLCVGSTPFDEKSVRLCEKSNVDFVKIASCSMTDWSLLEEISNTCPPEYRIVISTGGHCIEDVDNVVSFFKHKNKRISLLHCVSLYPVKDSIDFNMNFIDKLKKRYPGIDIGYSGHEEPNDFMPGIIAASKNIFIFERHIGKENLNDYSLDDDFADNWVKSILRTIAINGKYNKTISEKEIQNISGLQRGVYSCVSIEEGEVISSENTNYCMPVHEDQLTSGKLNSYRNKIVASRKYVEGDVIHEIESEMNDISYLRKYVHSIIGYVNESGIDIGKDYEFELSHHYGIQNFDKYGAGIISIINREYCKKLIVQLSNMQHPAHFHKIKEETFHILEGSMILNLENKDHLLQKGDVFTVQRYNIHSFKTDTGVIFEEISTTHIQGDSHYIDRNILKLDPNERKTKVVKP